MRSRAVLCFAIKQGSREAVRSSDLCKDLKLDLQVLETICLQLTFRVFFLKLSGLQSVHAGYRHMYSNDFSNFQAVLKPIVNKRKTMEIVYVTFFIILKVTYMKVLLNSFYSCLFECKAYKIHLDLY